MAQPISQLISSFQAGGTVKIPACIVNGVEIAQLGYSCYNNVEVTHRVSEICTLPSLGEEGELGAESRKHPILPGIRIWIAKFSYFLRDF